MLIKISHPSLELQKTYLLADIAAAATSASVENTDDFTTNDLVLVGAFGTEKAEIITLTSVTPNQTIGFTGACKFSHSARTQLVRLKWNQAEIYRASTEDGSYSLIATVSLNPDEDDTVYDDTTGDDTSWYKVRYKNSVTSNYSSYTDAVQGTGYSDDSLYSMTEDVLENLGDPNGNQFTRKQVRKALNATVRKLVIMMAKVMPDYRRAYEKKAITSSLTDLPSNCLTIYKATVNCNADDIEDSYKATFEDEQKGYRDSLESELNPKIYFRGDQFGVRPATVIGYAYFYFLQAPTAMTDPTDTHGLPYGARDVLVDGAVYRILKDTKTNNESSSQLSRYRTDFKESAEEYIEFVAQSRQQMTPKNIKITFGDEMYD